MLYVKIPKERVGVLIGPDGKVKTQIERSCGVKLEIDSKIGEVTVIPKAKEVQKGHVGLAARDIVQAIASGFSPDRAMQLANEDMYFSIVDIRDFAGKERKHVARIRARLIGTNGKTRRIIEDLSESELSIYGNTVAIIGDLMSMDASRRAVEMLLEGSEHSAVYRFLETKHREMRFMEMSMH